VQEIDFKTQSYIHGILEDWLTLPLKKEAYTQSGYHEMALGSTLGFGRDNNEDVVVFASFSSSLKSSFNLAIIADGIGGLEDGESCARATVIEIISYLISLPHLTQNFLIEAVNYTNKKIFDKWGGKGGSTLSLVIFTKEWKAAINVGDSRIYSLSFQGIQQLSSDDNLLEGLGGLTDIKPLGINANSLIQYIGMGYHVIPHLITIQNSEDKDSPGILISTDGVHTKDDSIFKDIAIKSEKNPLSLIQRLMALAKWRKISDNGSVFVSFGMDRFLPHRNANYEKIHIWVPGDKILITLPSPSPVNTPPKPQKNRKRKKNKESKKDDSLFSLNKAIPSIRIEHIDEDKQ
jgi:serine/threonine protein phosphatase PrpC